MDKHPKYRRYINVPTVAVEAPAMPLTSAACHRGIDYADAVRSV